MSRHISHHISPCAIGLKYPLGASNCGEVEGESGEQEEVRDIDSHDVGGVEYSGGREAEGEEEVGIVKDLSASTLDLA